MRSLWACQNIQIHHTHASIYQITQFLISISSEASMHLSISLTSLNQNNAILRCHMWNEIETAVTKNRNRKEDTQTQILLMASSTTSRLGDFFLSNIAVLKSFFDFLNQKPEFRKEIKLKDQNFVIGITERTFSVLAGRIWKSTKQQSSTINNTISLETKEMDLLRKSTHNLNTKKFNWRRKRDHRKRDYRKH